MTNLQGYGPEQTCRLGILPHGGTIQDAALISGRDLLVLSSRQVFRRKRRNAGVLIAIALGIAGLITIMSVGDEVKKNLNHDLDLLGGVTLIKTFFEEERQPGNRPEAFLPETLENLRRFPGVALVSAASKEILWLSLEWHQSRVPLPVLAVDADYWQANNVDLVGGATFDQTDLEKHERICVIGVELANTLGGVEQALGLDLPIGRDLYRVIGVVEGLQLGDRARFAFIPLTTAMDRNPEKRVRPNRLTVRCKTWDDVPKVAGAIPHIVAAYQSPEFLKVDVAWTQLKRIVAIVWWVQLFIYLSIVATLVLGGFGIWNGMMSSVTARTREIGLKKAMGAEQRDIMMQILCESVLLSVSAAILGVALGLAAVAITSHHLGSTPPHDVILHYSLVSLLFSCLLGIGAGIYPALRAARMDPVVAIRYE